jgi:uncharacterized protein YqeY
MADVTTAERVERDLIEALRARDSTRLATLRLLKTAAKNAEVAKREPLTEDEYQAIVRRQVKMRREAATEYDRGNRPEQAAQERAELALLEAYLPAQLDADALSALVAQAIAETGASGPRDLGKVMSQVMQAAQGRADGAQVSQMARTLLTQQAG